MKAFKAAKIKEKGKNTAPAKTEVGIRYINKLYAIGRQFKSLSETECHRIRQKLGFA